MINNQLPNNNNQTSSTNNQTNSGICNLVIDDCRLSGICNLVIGHCLVIVIWSLMIVFLSGYFTGGAIWIY